MMGAMLHEHRFGVSQITLTVAEVAAATTAEQTFTVTGLKLGDFVAVSKPTVTAGVGVLTARVSAADTLAIQFINATAGALTPAASQVYLLHWFRPEIAGLTTVVD